MSPRRSHPAATRVRATLALAGLVGAALVAVAAPTQAGPVAAGSLPARASAPASAPVEPTIRTVPLTGVDPAAARRLPSKAVDQLAALSAAVPTTGYATVGVTWGPGETVAGQTVAVRTRTNGAWSGWEALSVSAEHAPTPDTAEAADATPGTDPLVVGDVDVVQVKVTHEPGRHERLPANLALSVVDPGRTGAARLGAPAYPATNGAGGVTARPGIYSRAQWGANESMRDGFAGYGEVHAAFVHHTVNANGYTREQVPSILRGIYAYHTQSQGWSDIGYNFLVDRFGRLWEGRWGGIARPVIGAHTLNYNEDAFAMSAIGNFETVQPAAAMLRAYGRLLAWKLSLHGVVPDSGVTIDGHRFRTVNGHRDAAATACPGRNLYARLPLIRSHAVAAQHGWSGRSLFRSVVSDSRPDLLARTGDRASVLAGDGGPGFRAAIGSTTTWAEARNVLGVGDLTGDRRGDLFVRKADGTASTVPGAGDGTFGAPVSLGSRFAGSTLVAGVRDLTGDLVPDLVHRDGAGVLQLAAGRRDGGYAPDQVLSDAYPNALSVLPAGDADSDGDRDLLVFTAARKLVLVPGYGDGTVGTPRTVAAWPGRTPLTAGFDMTGDGRPDLLMRNDTTGLVRIRPGLGDGSYGRGLAGWTGWEDVRVSMLGDADGDSLVDVLVRRPGGTVAVHPGRNGAWVHPVRELPAGWGRYDWTRVVGDWDRDGDDDVLGRDGDRMWLLRGRGDGSFRPPVGGWPGWARRGPIAAVGDWTGDGRPDLVSRRHDGSAWVHPGRGLDGFGPAYEARSYVGAPAAMFGVGRWNGDGAPDLMTRTQDGALRLWPGNGPGGLEDAVLVATGMDRYDALLGVGDLTRDGHPDLVGRLADTSRLYLLPGQPGGLDRPVPIGSGPVPGALT